MIGRIERPFHRLLDFAITKPKRTLALHAIVLALCLFGLSLLKTELRLYDVIDGNFPSTQNMHDLREHFGSSMDVQVLFRPFSGTLTESNLCSIKNWSHQLTRQENLISYESSILDLRAPTISGEKLWYPRLTELNCQQSSDKPAQDILNKLYDFSYFKASLNPRGEDFAMGFYIEQSKENSSTKVSLNQAGAIIDAATKFGKEQNLEVHFMGTGTSRWYLNQAFQRDLLLQTLIFVVIFLLFRFFLGTWRAGFFYASTLLVTMLITLGGMGLFGSPIDLLNCNLLLITAIAAMEDFLFLSLAAISRPKAHWSEWFKEMSAPAFFTSLTTILGFVSLAASDMHLIQRFGLWAGFAAFVEWWILFAACPALFSLLKKKPSWSYRTKAWDGTWLQKMEKLTPPRWLAHLLLVVAVASPFTLYFASSHENMNLAFAEDHPFSKNMKYWKDTRHWEGAVSIMASSESDISKRLPQFLAVLKKDSNIYAVENPWDWQKQWTQNFTEDLQRMLSRELKMTPLWKRQFSITGETKLTVYLKSLDRAIVNQTLSDINKLCQDWNCKVAGEVAVFEEYSNKVPETLLESFFVSLVLVSFVLVPLALLFKGSMKSVLLSGFFGPFFFISVLTLTRTPLSIPVSVLAAVLVGLSGDNAIQYLFGSKGKDLMSGVEDRAKASVILTIVLCVSSLIFLGMSQIAIRNLGPLFIAGFIVNLAGDLWILRSLLSKKSS